MELRQKAPGANASVMPTEAQMLSELTNKKATGYFAPEHMKGNVILCEKLAELRVYLQFINKMLPWVHTVILPDFTHFIAEAITEEGFRARKLGGEQYAKYLDLAADTLKNFIASSNVLRHDLIVVTEYHLEFDENLKNFHLFLPGGQMVREKFMPASYYDILVHTKAIFGDDPAVDPTQYVFVTRATVEYPQARTSDLYEFAELEVPNNLQDLLTRFRNAEDIPIPAMSDFKKKEKAAA
jgi:hypothetical protein